MSIPLDRLYHYIDSVAKEICSDDIIIYRYYPDGSKNIDHLLPLKEMGEYNWVKLMTDISMICHDQEPLNHRLYSPEIVWNHFNSTNQNRLLTEDSLPGIKELVTSMHLRVATKVPFNCYDKILLTHSEKNSPNLHWYENNGFVGVYWWSHAAIARDWFRYAEHDSLLKFNVDNITKDFLVYNRAWSGTREYRLLFTELVANYNLNDSCNMRFSPWDNETHYHNHKFKNKNLAISRQDLDVVYSVNDSTPYASADYNSYDYANSGIEIVLETLFDDQRHHLTEKSLRPIACGRPFILASTPGSLAYLQNYGFETFQGIIDESYDSIQDPTCRLHAIVQEMQRINKLDRQSKIIVWEKLYTIAERNRQKFFSLQWQNKISNEYSTNLELAVCKIKEQATGKYWRSLNSLGKHNAEYIKSTTTDLPQRTVQQREQVIKWLQDRNQ